MKKVLLILASASLLILPAIVLANDIEGAPTVDIMEVIARMTDWAFDILMAMAIFCIIVAAFYFVTAGGDSQKVTMARTWLTYTFIGVAVALAARGIVALIRAAITG